MRPKGKTLRAVREARKVSGRKLAEHAGISHQFLFRLEQDRATASEATMQSFADKLGVDLSLIAHTEPAEVSL
jgi:transcriptional regulator with XRE-family HTH domain